MAIESEDSQFVGLSSELYARNVSVGILRYIEFTSDTALDVETMYRYLGIALTSLWVFILVSTWIELIICHFRACALEVLESKSAHVGFIKTNPCQHLRIGREIVSTIVFKFLFIHPVRLSIDDVIELSIGRDLTLRIVEKQLHEEQVVITDKGNHGTIGGELWHFL